jgi:hypothetical protein
MIRNVRASTTSTTTATIPMTIQAAIGLSSYL